MGQNSRRRSAAPGGPQWLHLGQCWRGLRRGPSRPGFPVDTPVRHHDAEESAMNEETRRALPDLVAPGLKAIFCGLNPGGRGAASGHHFEGRGNRFWPVLHQAGFTPRLLTPREDSELPAFGYGLTTVVARPTASAR